jgi:thiol-disulfide isomerase/thioredoxin
MTYKLLICFSYLFMMGCDSSDNSQKENVQIERIDSFASAVPHGVSLAERELSDEDKLKLAKAVGKEAVLITIDSLKDIIEGDSSGWCLYSFWNLDCGNCMEINKNLELIKNMPEMESKLEIKYINTISLYPDQVNAYIRENGIVDEVFTIPTDKLDDWTNRFDVFWDGKLPALLLINNIDGTRLFYQQTFSKEELQAVLETLTL